MNDIREYILSLCTSCKESAVLTIDEEIKHFESEMNHFENGFEFAQNEVKRLKKLKLTKKELDEEEKFFNKAITEQAYKL